ncbi:MAG: hypothetical protein KGL62_12965 [Bradyrhizobium sp.]|uniref:hypothetical protein n=1 Tax=Bradyrhizobium sp. TaxID=376 RepID=UPI00239B0EA4|nr:hypothetical protein [Bradyrhizobium sp.]MDE2603262.1 hypothetical protein [Bradyrhizobium sp.]
MILELTWGPAEFRGANFRSLSALQNTPGGWNDRGRRARGICNVLISEHAEHNCADKGESNIGGNDAQFAGESHGIFAGESHGISPWFSSQTVVTRMLARRSRKKKPALLLYRDPGSRRDRGGVVKKS